MIIEDLIKECKAELERVNELIDLFYRLPGFPTFPVTTIIRIDCERMQKAIDSGNIPAMRRRLKRLKEITIDTGKLNHLN